MRGYLSLLFLLSVALSAQEVAPIITLTNPSFEDYPRVGFAPRGWTDCGFPGESAVDIQPDPQKEFQVVKQAQDGRTYLGMVTRDNETHERISQRMGSSMIAGQCYELRVQLARSEQYISKSRLTDTEQNYVTPVKLVIRGGYSVCDLGPVLGESPLVENWNWQEYRIKLKPTEDYSHIVLQAYYRQPILFPYNGNILVDNAQDLRPVACDEDLYNPRTAPATVQVEPKAAEEAATTQQRTQPAPAIAKAPAPAKPSAPVVELGKTRGELKIGQVFEIEDITFKSNSAELEKDSERALGQIVGFLRNNRDVVVEIGGHASYQAGPVYANRISQERAEAVITYLQNHDIGASQLLPRGYGKTRPVCMEQDEACNQRNQRVEVKILKVRSR